MSQTSAITPALKAQCIQEAIDCKNATAGGPDCAHTGCNSGEEPPGPP